MLFYRVCIPPLRFPLFICLFYWQCCVHCSSSMCHQIFRMQIQSNKLTIKFIYFAGGYVDECVDMNWYHHHHTYARILSLFLMNSINLKETPIVTANTPISVWNILCYCCFCMDPSTNCHKMTKSSDGFTFSNQNNDELTYRAERKKLFHIF